MKMCPIDAPNVSQMIETALERTSFLNFENCLPIPETTSDSISGFFCCFSSAADGAPAPAVAADGDDDDDDGDVENPHDFGRSFRDQSQTNPSQ